MSPQKPAPPDSLLLPRQRWIVVEAVFWELVAGRQHCYFSMGSRRKCGSQAIIKLKSNFLLSEGLCELHMGSHMWIDNGVLYQWRADPPYKNRRKK